MRKHRATRIEENIAIEKRLAKEDMKHMRKFGKVPTHCSEVSKYTANVPRKKRLKDEDEIWKNYCKENEEQKKLFETMKPGTAAQLKVNEQKEEEERRLDDERKEAEEDEDEEDGYWRYMPDCDGYIWEGSGPAPDCSNAGEGMCENPYNLTEEQLEEQKKEDKEYFETFMEWEFKERRKEKAEKLKERRKKNAESVQRFREKVKAKLQVPVNMPDYEMSQYELIRQKNIEEIEKMKKANGFFDNFHNKFLYKNK